MSITADATTYGDISSAPGRRSELENVKNLATKTSAGITGATTVKEAEDAIYAIALADKAVSTKAVGRATRKETGAVATFGTRVNGTGYTNGTYTAVALSGGSGYGATANITVSGGAVTAATLVEGGQWYQVGDSLSCQLIGAGTNFALPVATVTQG